MEEEYGFDLVLRYGVRWRFLLMMGIHVKVEIVDFCDLNLVLGLCPTRKLAVQIWFRVYSLSAILCNSSQIHSEAFSSACGFFPVRVST